MTRCPCCKQPVETEKPLVDLRSNRISFRGREAKLTPRTAELVSILAEQMPMPVEWDRMITRVYGFSEPGDAAGTIRVHANTARPRLREIGLTIRNCYGSGYRLEALS